MKTEQVKEVMKIIKDMFDKNVSSDIGGRYGHEYPILNGEDKFYEDVEAKLIELVDE